jgi:hypothetical protein
MLTRAPIGPSDDLDRPAGPAALIGAGVGVGLTVLLADAFHWTRYDLPPTGTARRIGEQVFGAWVLPFEVLSILLLAALVGAIVLSRPDLGARPGPAAAAVPAEPVPDPSTESDAVSARLERIAARQASAQARMRQAAAEERATAAAAERAAAAQPAEAATSTITADPVDQARKGRAHDVIFGAHERRARVGDDMPDESRTMEGTATERPTPQRRPTTRRPAIEGTIEGEVVEDRPALPSGKNDSRNDGEKAGGEDA